MWRSTASRVCEAAAVQRRLSLFPFRRHGYNRAASTSDRDAPAEAPELRVSMPRRRLDPEGEAFMRLSRELESRSDSLEAVRDWVAAGNRLSGGIASRLRNWITRRKSVREARDVLEYLKFAQCENLGAAQKMEPHNKKVKKKKKMKNSDGERAEKLVRSVEAWNALLAMYMQTDKFDRVLATFKRFKTVLKPNLKTWLYLLQARDKTGGYPELDLEALTSVKEIALENAREEELADLMMIYAYVGRLRMLERIASMFSSGDRIAGPKFYKAAIRSFGKLGAVKKSQELMDEMLVKQKQLPDDENPFLWMIEVYVGMRMMKDAESLVKRHFSNKPCFEPYNFLIAGYAEMDRAEEAFDKLDQGLAAVAEDDEEKPKHVRLEYGTMVGLLRLFAKTQDVDRAETLFFDYYHSCSCGDVSLFNQMLNVYAAAGANPPADLKRRMKEQGIKPNEQTQEILTQLRACKRKKKKKKKQIIKMGTDSIPFVYNGEELLRKRRWEFEKIKGFRMPVGF